MFNFGTLGGYFIAAGLLFWFYRGIASKKEMVVIFLLHAAATLAILTLFHVVRESAPDWMGRIVAGITAILTGILVIYIDSQGDPKLKWYGPALRIFNRICGGLIVSVGAYILLSGFFPLPIFLREWRDGVDYEPFFT